jgi:hypothetical protein
MESNNGNFIETKLRQIEDIKNEIENYQKLQLGFKDDKNFFLRFGKPNELVALGKSLGHEFVLNADENAIELLQELFGRARDREGIDLSIPVITDPRKLLDIEANRPLGFLLPEDWNLKSYMKVGFYTILGGYSGIGKSTVMLNLIYDAIQKNRKCLVFSIEMTAGQLWIRLLGLALYKKYGYKNQDFFTVMNKYKGQDHEIMKLIISMREKIYVIDATGFTCEKIKSVYWKVVNEEKINIDQVFIDYVQIIKPSQNEIRDRRLQIIMIVDFLTRFMKSTNSAWILLAQTSRPSKFKSDGGAEDHSSFMESASLEQNAALAITLARKQNQEGEWIDQMEIRIAKNRFGAVGKTFMQIDPCSGALYRV